MGTFKGLVYVKHGRVGSKSEGPDYYLQTCDGEYLLKYVDRCLWKPDYLLLKVRYPWLDNRCWMLDTGYEF